MYSPLGSVNDEDDQNLKQSIKTHSDLDDTEMGKKANAHGAIDGLKNILRKSMNSRQALNQNPNKSQIEGMITDLHCAKATTVEQEKKL